MQFLNAVVKFNGGRGALLCNKCHTIIRYGFDHSDEPHYCAECNELKAKAKLEHDKMHENE